VLHVWAGVARVAAAVHGPGRLDLYAVKRAGDAAPVLSAEAYAGDDLVAAGELQVWELNQAIAALLSRSSQARRLALRADPRGHGGYLDVVAREDVVDLVGTSADGARRVTLGASALGLAASLNALLHHYLELNRPADSHIVVLPDVVTGQPASARAALIRPAP
jgi:hypothetical protein